MQVHQFGRWSYSEDPTLKGPHWDEWTAKYNSTQSISFPYKQTEEKNNHQSYFLNCQGPQKNVGGGPHLAHGQPENQPSSISLHTDVNGRRIAQVILRIDTELITHHLLWFFSFVFDVFNLTKELLNSLLGFFKSLKEGWKNPEFYFLLRETNLF